MGEERFGRIAEDGTVYVKLPNGDEHAVGQWAAGDPTAGLAYFQRRYAELVFELDHARKRLKAGHATPDQALAAVTKVKEAITTPNFVGDITGLGAKADALSELVESKRTELSAAKKQAKADALERRTAIAAEAEKLADSQQWKATGQRFRELLEEWKALPRFDKGAEQKLWERFSAARTKFDKARRHHFSELDDARAQAVLVKDDIIRRAEALSTSTDWGDTARAFRDLMSEWKQAPRAGRAQEDRLWAAFRAAQDKFFDARNAKFAERNEEEVRNLEAKKELLTEIEALFPVKDPRVAREKFSALMGRWEQIGHVPREDKAPLEKRLRAFDRQIKDSEKDHWRRTDPAALAFAENTARTFQASVEKLEKQLAKAEAAGDERKVKDLQQSLASTRALLEAAQGAVAEYSGGS